MRTRGDPEANQANALAGREDATALRGTLSPEGLSCFSEPRRVLAATPDRRLIGPRALPASLP